MIGFFFCLNMQGFAQLTHCFLLDVNKLDLAALMEFHGLCNTEGRGLPFRVESST